VPLLRLFARLLGICAEGDVVDAAGTPLSPSSAADMGSAATAGGTEGDGGGSSGGWQVSSLRSPTLFETADLTLYLRGRRWLKDRGFMVSGPFVPRRSPRTMVSCWGFRACFILLFRLFQVLDVAYTPTYSQSWFSSASKCTLIKLNNLSHFSWN